MNRGDADDRLVSILLGILAVLFALCVPALIYGVIVGNIR